MRFSFLLILLTVGAAEAADPPKGMEGTITRQRESVALMERALSTQRSAVSAQRSETSAEPFFLLPPPSRSAPPLQALPRQNCDPVPALEMDAIIQDAASTQDLHPQLLRGVIKQESAFVPCAVSTKGAMGLMQLMPATAAQLGVRDPFSPKENVDAGARFLKQLLHLYGNLPMALGAYNAGPGNVNQAGGVPDFPETKSYIRSILSGLPPELRIQGQ